MQHQQHLVLVLVLGMKVRLNQEQAVLVLVEPNIDEIPQGFDVPTTELMDLEPALLEADVVVLLVDHTLFKEMDLGLLSGKQVVDTRGTWS